jgi:YaiO family outer membrane protein
VLIEKVCNFAVNITISMYKQICFLFIAFLCANSALAQDNALSSDELFIQSRKEAFDQKNYPKAIQTIRQALVQSPNYTDLSVFLGRLYTWSDQIDSARATFDQLWKRDVDSDDFYLAYASLEYWHDDADKALTILDKGLFHTPSSETLLFLKAKVLYGENRYEQASAVLDKILTLDSKNTEAREMAAKINDVTSKNSVGVTYNYVHFDKQFADDWHIVGVSYKRATGFGSLIFRTNYANKFADNGVQFELEAYPRLSKMFYMYIGTGYSNHVGLFPKFRTGASLYANLPKSFEGEIGFRQLYFSDNLFMYTASVGKYYQNFWFNLRTFLTPSDSNISHSYTGTIRYYTKGANDYLGFHFGTGISPEENRNNLLEGSLYKMKTYKAGVDYNFSIQKRNLFSISATYFNQEYQPLQKGNQLDISLGYVRNF